MWRQSARVLIWACGLALWSLAAQAILAQAAVPRVLVWERNLMGTEEQRVRLPLAVAARSDEEVAVADASPPRLLIFRKIGVSWQMAQAVELPGTPLDLIFDGSRYLVVLREGFGLMALEPSGSVLEPVDLPSDLVPGAATSLPGGGLALYDLRQGEVVLLSATGEPIGAVAVSGRVTALEATLAGGFYVAVAESARVDRYSAAGTLEGGWSLPSTDRTPAWPVGITVDPGGGVGVVDRHGGRVLFFDNDGRFVGTGARRGQSAGLLHFPRAMARMPDGRLLIADEGNGRVQIFQRVDSGVTE